MHNKADTCFYIIDLNPTLLRKKNCRFVNCQFIPVSIQMREKIVACAYIQGAMY